MVKSMVDGNFYVFPIVAGGNSCMLTVIYTDARMILIRITDGQRSIVTV